MEPFERLRLARQHAGYDGPAEAARAFRWNVNTYKSHENGVRGLTRNNVKKYAKAFRVSEGWLLIGEGQGPDGASTPSIESSMKSQIQPSKGIATKVQRKGLTPSRAAMLLTIGPRDLPILGAAKGGSGDAVFVTNGEVFDYAARPGTLIGIKDAYGVYMVGDCMEERYYAGEILHVNPNKPVRTGHFVVVQIEPGPNQDWQYLVKQFVRRDAKRLVLREFKPKARELEFPAATVRAVHRIVGSASDD